MAGGGNQPDKHSKTEAPSQHKLRKSREQGQVAKSQDLSGTSSLIVAMVMIALFSPRMVSELDLVFKKVLLDFNFEMISESGINLVMIYVFQNFFVLVLPIVFAVWITAFVITVAQVGFHFSTKPLEPSFDKINPVNGFKKLFSKRGIVNTTLAAIKMLIIFVVAGSVLWNHSNTLVLVNLHSIAAILSKAGGMLWEITMKSSIVLIIMAIIDFAYQKWQFHEDQKMTKHELKEEFKEHEGNPTIKSKIKSLQKAGAQKRGLKETVQEADVVVTNPFHIAVAIKYDRENGQTAPIVVAKGARLLAQRIKDFAKEADIEIIVNIPLARSLYKQCQAGFEISPDLYIAVAEVLAAVFRKRDANRNIRGKLPSIY